MAQIVTEKREGNGWTCLRGEDGFWQVLGHGEAKAMGDPEFVLWARKNLRPKKQN